MNRDRKTLYMILGVVLVSIFSLSIVYAALSVTLNINGQAEVSSASWDVHLENIVVTEGSVSGSLPSITNPTTANFSTKLTTPGDFYEFTVDVVNDGTIDAMIDSVTKNPTLSEAQLKYLSYDVTYGNGESINTKQLVEKDSFVRLKVRVEFRKDLVASDLPTQSETLNLSFIVNYVQADDSGVEVENNGSAISIIEFSIAGTTYQAIEGMTWQDWVNSEYNTGSFIIDSYDRYNYVSNGSVTVGLVYDNGDESYVESTDSIIANTEYIAKTGSND